MARKRFKRLIATAVAVGAVLLTTACSGQLTPGESGSKQAKDNSQITIGVALPTQQETRWQRDAKFFAEEGKAAGVKVVVQQANGDANTQVSQIQNFITQGVDGIIIGAVDPATLGPVATQALKAGIKVVGYARAVQNAKVNAIVAFNYLKVGELQGAFAYSKAPKGNYVILNGDSTTVPDAPLYHQGALNGINPGVKSGAIKIVTDQYDKNWDPSVGLANTEDALSKAPDIAAVIAANDGLAGGAIQALTKAGLAGKTIVVGNDSDLIALKRIVKGTQTATIFQNNKVESQKTMDATIAFIKGKKVTTNGTVPNGNFNSPGILLQPQLVTKDTLDSIIVKSGFYTHAEIYGN